MIENTAVLASMHTQSLPEGVGEARLALPARVAALVESGALSLPQDLDLSASIAQWSNWTNG